VDGPAVEYANGTKWYVDGNLHRVDGPAVEYANGTKWWYLTGKKHRVDGPAIEFANGGKEWFLNGVKMSELEHRQAIYNRFLPVYHFAYEFPGGMDAGIRNRLLSFIGFH
jgi:hypothetical protein